MFRTSSTRPSSDVYARCSPLGYRRYVPRLYRHGQVRLLSNQDKVEKSRIKGGATFILDRERTLDLEGAMAKAWYEFKPEAPVQTAFDLQGSVQSLVKRYEGALDKGLTIENKDDALKTLKALLAQLESA